MASGLSEYEFQIQKFTEEKDYEEDEEEEEEVEVNEVLSTNDMEIDSELQNAKQYLNSYGNNLYDHIAKVLVNIFDHRPVDAADIFEALSIEVKMAKSNGSSESMMHFKELATESNLAQIQKKIFTQTLENEEEAVVDEEGGNLQDLMESSYFFEQAGVGINKEEMFKIFLAMKQLVTEKALQGARFWGKLFGLEQNYIVVEADYVEGEETEEEEVEEEQEENVELEEEEEMEDGSMPLPKITYKPPLEVPKEEPGTGVNKQIYFVCNDPGKFWTRLPPVTPKQISVSQKITKFLTGRLDAPVVSFPPFPGNEISYLRAQIARISAATQVSPTGYYNTEEEEEEEEGGISSISLNPDYEAPTMKELVEQSLDGWVHHVPYILPQGRCAWWNPTPEQDEEEEEDEGAEVKPIKKAKPQVGPPILTPLSEDNKLHNLAPWTVELSSKISPNDGVVVVHSNLWPGAHGLFTGEKFENIYIGWGVKNSVLGYSPSMPSFLAREFDAGADLVEMLDPSVEEEFPPDNDEEEEGGEEEEGEEDDETEDEDNDEN